MRSPIAERIAFRRITPADAGAFHGMLVDQEVRRYLLDGKIWDRSEAGEAIRASDLLFEQRGVGLWILSCDADIGFAGYHVFAEHEPEPQLIYALLPGFWGRGLATEAAQSCIEFARTHAGFGSILAAVDAPNVASIRVIERLGFERAGSFPGAFGETYRFVLP